MWKGGGCWALDGRDVYVQNVAVGMGHWETEYYVLGGRVRGSYCLRICIVHCTSV